MSQPWENDKSWSDAYLPTIKAILGQCLIGEAAREEDQERNTDLIVLRMNAVRIACRLRRYEYLSRFSNDFTIRFTRPSGIKSEFTKIIEGWGDFFFYGFGCEDPPEIAQWFVGDLKEFRITIVRYMYKHDGKLPGIVIENKDSSSEFLAIDTSLLPPQFFIARYPT